MTVRVEIVGSDVDRGEKRKVAEREGLPFPVVTAFLGKASLRVEPVGSHPFDGFLGKKWRRERDSNPRNLSAQWFSRPPHSTTLPSLRWKVGRYRFELRDGKPNMWII